jgi:hypothetical protein
MLEALSNVIVVHFVGNKYLSLDFVKHCELLYVRRFAILTWLTWLRNIHLGYKGTTIDSHLTNNLLLNGVPTIIIRSIFKSTNVALADNEH